MNTPKSGKSLLTVKASPCNTSLVISKNNTVCGEVYTYLVDEIQKTRLKLCLVAMTAPFPSRGKMLFEAKIGLKLKIEPGLFPVKPQNTQVFIIYLASPETIISTPPNMRPSTNLAKSVE